MKNTLGLIFISLIITSCIGLDKFDERDHAINFFNQTDDIVYVYISSSDSLLKSQSIKYLDTNDNVNYRGITFYPYPKNRVDIYDVKEIYNNELIDGNWDKPMLSSNDKKLRVFIISEQTMKNYSWAEICDKQMYERKFIITEKELDSLDSEFIYTGKDMKELIYPEKE